MGEGARIADPSRRSFEGGAGHGPSRGELLANVTAAQAAARPLAGAHSIWDIVLHVAAWQRAARLRIAGEAVDLEPREDWPPRSGSGEDDWERAVIALEQGSRRLRRAVARLQDAALDAPVPGQACSAYVLLHGVIQHNLYHAGQIALLKRRIAHGRRRASIR